MDSSLWDASLCQQCFLLEYLLCTNALRFLRESLEWYHRHSSDKHRPSCEQEGCAAYTTGSTTLEAKAGQIAIIPAGVLHTVVHSGSGRLSQRDIHHGPRFITEWLEDQCSRKLPYLTEEEV
ncbi:MAG: hypothetical protein ACXVDA_09655 [Ktedonobacterales bacterium]